MRKKDQSHLIAKKPVIKNRKTESAKTSEKVKKQEQPKQVEKTKTAFTIRKREE